MTPEDIKLIDEVVTNFRNKLLSVGHLSRTNARQKRALAEAHSLILNLPAILREPKTQSSLAPKQKKDET